MSGNLYGLIKRQAEALKNNTRAVAIAYVRETRAHGGGCASCERLATRQLVPFSGDAFCDRDECVVRLYSKWTPENEALALTPIADAASRRFMERMANGGPP